jgi:hypothetical protein
LQVNREADPEKRAAKKRALEAKNRLGSSAPGSKTESKNDSLPPNKLLFADNLPGERAQHCCSCRLTIHPTIQTNALK